MRGHPVYIPQQNARLLGYLIQKTGRLATRDELQNFLWPESAPNDAQQAINKAISQLRAALNDPSTRSGSRYIETIPRRGYRFCAEFHLLPLPKTESLQLSSNTLPMEPTPLEDDRIGVLLPPISDLAYPERQDSSEIGVRRKTYRRTRMWWTALLLCLFASGLFVWKKGNRLNFSPPPVLRTIGVPPMETVGPNATALAESFRLDLTESLAQLPQIKVLSVHAFTSSPRYSLNVSELARSQNADLLLPGRFEVKDGRYYLEFELVRNSDYSHLASLHYEGAPEQLRGLITKIQEDVFTKLKLTSSGESPLKTTTTPEAYQAYVQGRHYLVERTDAALNKSIAQFKQAIDLDPKFAKAYSGLASAYMILASHRSFPDGYQMSRGLALHALQLDPSVAEAHALLGCIAMSKDWDTRTSEAELQRAIELEPDEASYHIWIATTYNIEGHFKESLHQIDLAKMEDPYWPPVYQSEVLAAANAGEKKRVISSAQTLLQLTPSWPMAHNTVASAFWAVGRYPEAIAEWRTMYALDNDHQGIQLEDAGLKALRSGGPAAYARLHADNAKLVAGTNEAFTPLAVAEWSAEAGQTDAALDIIQSLSLHRDPSAVTIGVDPAFTGLQSHPRFRKILEQAGLNFRQ